MKHWSTALRKHMLPRFTSPAPTIVGSISRGRYEENGGLVSLFQDHGEVDEEDKEEKSIRFSSSRSRVSS